MRKDHVNLLPIDVRIKHKIAKEPLLAGAFICVILYISVSFFIIKNEMGMQEANLKQVVKQEAALKRQLASLERNNGKENIAIQRSTKLKSIVTDSIQWSVLFKELSSVTPKTIWLTNLISKETERNYIITITGNSPSQSNMSDFFKALEDSAFFRDVKVLFSEQVEDVKPKLYRFQFEIPLSKQLVKELFL